MNKKTFRKAARISFFLLLFFLVSLIILDHLRISRAWLNVNNPINSSIYVCEGWLSPDYYDTLTNILYRKKCNEILVTGSKLPKTVTLYQNGYIILKNLVNQDTAQYKNVKFELSGSSAGGHFTHTRIFLNDSLLYAQYLRKSKMSFEIQTTLHSTDSVSIEFTNDYSERYEDRNLRIEKLSVNGQSVPLHSKNIWLKFKNIYINTSAKSYAENLANNLAVNGMKGKNVNFIVSSRTGLSKTFNAANDAVTWLKSHGYSSANIITADYHSRRTYISYKKADPNFKIGIITLPDKSHMSILKSKLRTLKELAGCVFIRVMPKFLLAHTK